MRKKRSALWISALWLVLFALLPLLLLLVMSVLSHSPEHFIIWRLTGQHYQNLVNWQFLHIILRSLGLAGLCTVITLVIAYPAAYWIACSTTKYKSLLLIFIIIPFWTSSLIRTYAMLAIIKTKGLLNTMLLGLGIIDQPLQLLYSNTAVIMALIYNLLPFMILPLYSSIEKIDPNLIDAARDLGGSRAMIMRRIIIPLSKPGIIAGILFVFLPAMTLFYIPDIVGGAKSLLLGNLIQLQFLEIGNWPAGSATSVVLTLLVLGLMLVYRRSGKKSELQALL